MAEDEYTPGFNPPPKPSTPRLAPWDHVDELCNKLERLIQAIEAQQLTTTVITEGGEAPTPIVRVTQEFEPVVQKLTDIETAVKDLKNPSEWTAKEPELIFRRGVRTAGTFYGDTMIDWTKGKRFRLKVTNSLDQDVSIQLIGNINKTKDGAADIGAAKTCPSSDDITIGPDWGDWHPYVGAKITVASAPTAGELFIWGVVQR
jgi:hypothetical protein